MEQKAEKPKFKIAFNSPVVLIFTGLCLTALLLGFITQDATTDKYFSVYRSSPEDLLTYVRLFGHVLGHAGWSHFLGNMMYILLLGPVLEEKYGSKNLIVVILATALITGLVDILLFPNTQFLGASGVVFAFILLMAVSSMKEHTIPITFILVAVLYIGNEIYSGVIAEDNVSQLTHIIGGIVGAVLGFFMNRQKEKKVAAAQGANSVAATSAAAIEVAAAGDASIESEQ